jgi:hypothetical protein
MVVLEQAVETEVKRRITWPAAPYKGLNYYSASDQPLFGQRDDAIESCARLVGAFSTKLLLIHGRTGTGKSSFVRAGLLPRLLSRNTGFVHLQTGGAHPEPYLIRCTDDPIMRLKETILRSLEHDPLLADVPDTTRRSVRELLQTEDHRDSHALAGAMYKSLAAITAYVRGCLLLTIDQSEEIFTLSVGNKDDRKREAFFALLEQFCSTPFDMKVIICLRTEYHGQFCNWFKIGPTLSVSTKRAGLEPFMLEGLQNRDSLVAAILRPTLQSLPQVEPAPFDKYGFSYAPGLADTIASDVLRHCGESSTLPVMQLVCHDLYNSSGAASRGETGRSDDCEIGFELYKKQGGVEGALDRFIEGSIAAVLKESELRRPSKDITEKWRDVIATLVARQEGGALTTLLVPIDELIEAGRQRGLRGDLEKCLTLMASEQVRLLRSATFCLPDQLMPSRNYSLGHDALAASLYHWKEIREKSIRDRRQAMRLKLIYGAIAVSLTFVCILALAQSLIISRQAIRMINAYAMTESSDDARTRLLLLLASWEKTQTLGPLGQRFLAYAETRHDIEQILRRSPRWMGSAQAFGINHRDNSIAQLNSNGEITVRSLPNLDEAKKVGTVDKPHSGGSVYWMSATGFVNDVGPVGYKNGWITYLPPSGPLSVKLSELIKDDQRTPPFVEVSGGSVRLTTFDRTSDKLRFGTIRNSGADHTLVYEPGTEYSLKDQRIWPTFSDTSDLYLAFGGQNATLTLNSRTDSNLSIEIATMKPQGEADQSAAAFGPKEFIRSAAFTAADEAIVLRTSKESFSIYANPAKGGPGFTPREIRIPENMQELALRPAWFRTRPLLAAAQVGASYRIAWLTTSSVFVWFDGESPLGSSELIASVNPLDSANKLKFSVDGRYLFLLCPHPPTHSEFRMWDLTEERSESIHTMSDRELRKEACRVAGLESLGNQFTDKELQTFPGIENIQPCVGGEP